MIAPDGREPVEHDIATHRYHHHTRVAVHRGKVWVAFSSGGTNEDSSGQSAAVVCSGDDGVSFSAPLRVLPPQSGWKRDGAGYESGSRIAYPRAFVIDDGALYLIVAIDAVQGTLDLVGAALVAVECRDDGSVSPPVRISSAACPPLEGVAPIPHDPVLAAALFSKADRFGHWGGSTPGNPPSEWTGWLSHEGQSYAEPATAPLDAEGKRWIRLWRLLSRGDRRRVYATVSEDGGATYSAPIRTDIPNSPSSLALLLLSDGRLALIGNPVDAGGVNRDPLYLAIFFSGRESSRVCGRSSRAFPTSPLMKAGTSTAVRPIPAWWKATTRSTSAIRCRRRQSA